MSYYGNDQKQPQWHQHSQTTGYNTTSYTNVQANGSNTQQPQNGQARQPIGPVLNQAVNNIAQEIKTNMDKDYFKTTDGLLNSIEVIASLIVFIIATNLHNYPLFTLICGFAFWISLLFLIINLFQLPEKIQTVPFTRLQFGFCGCTCALFILDGFILLFYSGILCLLALHLAAIFGYHTYDKLKEIGRIVSEQQNPQATANLNTNLNV